jgi:hypothetical protein
VRREGKAREGGKKRAMRGKGEERRSEDLRHEFAIF